MPPLPFGRRQFPLWHWACALHARLRPSFGMVVVVVVLGRVELVVLVLVVVVVGRVLVVVLEVVTTVGGGVLVLVVVGAAVVLVMVELVGVLVLVVDPLSRT